ncbi:predicted protein [Histoplasma mississippiense (nom. inval.)]|uniref:predicted protein n=1 Tax=Ajellomyces capsulatus (strain NAm1 / WU24) TaxID=2059318 RepID=UPI000157CB0D|nr:predicted protein [Histoplasma mississippiense (nom. inval.)]EDN09140.1 predicted protein [Histoplasma mississippiense (nom. inval.)]
MIEVGRLAGGRKQRRKQPFAASGQPSHRYMKYLFTEALVQNPFSRFHHVSRCNKIRAQQNSDALRPARGGSVFPLPLSLLRHSMLPALMIEDPRTLRKAAMRESELNGSYLSA